MSNYLIDSMVWSYSRLTCYEDCPYKFYLHYIEGEEEQPLWFAQYGTFMHNIIADLYRGETDRGEAVNTYLTCYREAVDAKPYSPTVAANYFNEGLEYLRNWVMPDRHVVAVEKQIDFDLGNRRFTGILDLVTVNNADSSLVITDHKSRKLKPRSTKGKVTKSDQELDSYFRQLYLYAYGFAQNDYYPTWLEFNCFRDRILIPEHLDMRKVESTGDWALDTIKTIANDTQFRPNIDWFYCRNLCGLHDRCEYARLPVAQ